MVSNEPYQVSYYISLGHNQEYVSPSIHNRDSYLYILDKINKQLENTSRVVVTAHKISLFYNHLLEVMTTCVEVTTYRHKLCECTIITTDKSTTTEPCKFNRADRIRTKYEWSQHQIFDFDEVIDIGVQDLYGLKSDINDMDTEAESEDYGYIDEDADYYSGFDAYDSSYDLTTYEEDNESLSDDSHFTTLSTAASAELYIMEYSQESASAISFVDFDLVEPLILDTSLDVDDFFPGQLLYSKTFIRSVCEKGIRPDPVDRFENDTLYILVMIIATLTPIAWCISYYLFQLVKFRQGIGIPRLLLTGYECLGT